MSAYNELESIIGELTEPLNGQYPRPWMTTSTDPTQVEVFIVGKNQAKAYPIDAVSSHAQYLNALFNRNEQSCHGLYDKVTNGKPSVTRRNTNLFVSTLARFGITQVLETNVICYSTSMSRHLSLPFHRGGTENGELIFRTLLNSIRPKILVVHGASATKQLAKTLSLKLPKPKKNTGELISIRTDAQLIVVMPSLAPPEFNKWSQYVPASQVYENVAKYIFGELAK